MPDAAGRRPARLRRDRRGGRMMNAMTHGPFWRCDDLATAIVRRLMARYGPDITIAQSGSPGVDQSFPVACGALGVAIEYRKVEFAYSDPGLLNGRHNLKPLLDFGQTDLDDRPRYVDSSYNLHSIVARHHPGGSQRAKG